LLLNLGQALNRRRLTIVGQTLTGVGDISPDRHLLDSARHTTVRCECLNAAYVVDGARSPASKCRRVIVVRRMT
jgi:hypothetical protein